MNSRGLPGEITTRLSWNTLGARFTLELESTTVPAERYSHLVLRFGQSSEPENQLNFDQDLSLEISSGSRTATLKCSSLHRLHYPDVFAGRGKTVMQTIRVPLVELEDQGIASADIRSISLCFDQRASGTIYVGGIARHAGHALQFSSNGKEFVDTGKKMEAIQIESSREFGQQQPAGLANVVLPTQAEVLGRKE